MKKGGVKIVVIVRIILLAVLALLIVSGLYLRFTEVRQPVTTQITMPCSNMGLYSKDDGKLYLYYDGEEKGLDLNDIGLEVRRQEKKEGE